MAVGLFFIWLMVGFGATFMLGPYMSWISAGFVGCLAGWIILDGGPPARTGTNLMNPLLGVLSGSALEIVLDPLGKPTTPRFWMLLLGSQIIAYFAANMFTLWRSSQGRGHRSKS